jgi:DNA-binding transcriptional LysR family regulator
VIREQGSSSRLAVIERFAREGVGLKVALESGSVDFIKEYVAEGRGLAFLYEPEIRAELESGRLVKIPLKGGDLELQTDVVFLAEAYQSPAVRAFLSVLEESATAQWSVLKDR